MNKVSPEGSSAFISDGELATEIAQYGSEKW